MCFVLYIATDAAIPNIPFDADSPALNIQPLSDRELPVRNVFTNSYVKFLGSSNHCGCGYRHLSYQNGEWPEEYLIGNDPEFGADTQTDHKSLHEFLLDQLQNIDDVELYGCWDGDFEYLPVRHEVICVDDLRSEEFFLRERCLYTVIPNDPAKNVG